MQLVKEALIFMRKNYKQSISIDEICKHICFSKYYFCRTFNDVTGKTVTEYLNMLRCQRVQKLLIFGKYNITRVAELAGFSNRTNFYKVYKKHMGYLPSYEQATKPLKP